MDLKARENAWRSKATDIFSRNAPVVSQDTSHEIKDLMHKYRHALQRKTKLWWNRSSLENYFEKKIIPRGLRVQLYPTYDLGNNDFITRWTTAASKCSLEFIQILIDNNTMSLLEIDNELDNLSRLLMKDMSNDQFTKWSKDLDMDISKWEEKVCQEKLKKYQRDVDDYDANKIYRWQFNGLKNNRRKRMRTQSNVSSVSNVSEAGSNVATSDVEIHRDSHTRIGEKKRFPDMFQKAQRGRDSRDRYQVINLSDHLLTTDQQLERGLSFSPSNRLDPFESVKDVHLFSRKLILKRLHANKSNQESGYTEAEKEAIETLVSLQEENTAAIEVNMIPNHLFTQCKTFPSLGLCPAVEVFTKLVSSDIAKLAQKQGGVSNLSKREQAALTDLKSWDDVVFKPADKGGNLVIWPINLYERQANKLLNDTSCYQRLTFNPLSSFQNLLIDILDKALAQGIIAKKLLDRIRNSHPKLPTFYLIPKIHKSIVDPPGRPIVADSAHPGSTIRGIPIGQFLRARRICSKEESFERQAVDLTRRFLDRGYSKKMIKRGYLRATKTTRNNLLYGTSSRNKGEQSNQIRFISTFSNKWDDLRGIVRNHWGVLMVDPVLRKILPAQPSFVAKRSANLRDTLVHSHFEPRKEKSKSGTPGFFPCGLCKGCRNHVKSVSFSNHDGSRTFDIRKHLSCNSPGVIYHAKCPCGKIYIGMTTRELKFREFSETWIFLIALWKTFLEPEDESKDEFKVFIKFPLFALFATIWKHFDTLLACFNHIEDYERDGVKSPLGH
ncbi:uncharacterized protein [Dendrobates tinctorius]|uniref:uncharacterized protein n=1 Tax=Dendrobates tinctorius TaxID=92724 RepID=UPI003CC9262F